MNDIIKTWTQRSFADNSQQLATVYMQAEIAELRTALEAARATPAQPPVPNHGLTTLLAANGATRHVRCHDGSGDAFDAYDKDIADRVVHELRAEIHRLESVIQDMGGCDMCNGNGSVGFPPDDYYPCPKCTPSVSKPSPSSVGDAIRAMLLPEPKHRGPDGTGSYFDSYTPSQVRALLSEAAALAEQVKVQGQGQGQQVPEGWKLVPIKPTAEMYIAGGELYFDTAKSWKRGSTTRDQDAAAFVWHAMLSAVPSIAQDGQKSEADHG